MSLLSSTIIFEKVNNFQFDRCIVLFNHLYSIFDQAQFIMMFYLMKNMLIIYITI